MNFLNQIIALIPDASAPVVVTIAGVMDFILRMVPSEKPLGILHVTGAWIGKVGSLLQKVAALSDKVLPQQIAQPVDPAAK